jgi:PIN domain nuclease of toxin-antitoxin system
MIVLDTHTLLWMDRNDSALGAQARQQIEEAWRSEGVAVSAISFWEAAMLAQRGRIVLPVPIEVWRAELLQAGVQEIAIDGRIALLATSLADLHKDPADRFIVATALAHQALLVTADSKILSWAGLLTRQDASS